MLHCMSMAIDWPDVIKTLGGDTILLGAVAWLIKTFISSRLTREVEQFKAHLKTNADTEIERLKSSLQMIALEHQVRFSKLHERRAELIAELYELLLDTESVARKFIFIETRDKKEAAAAKSKVFELYDFIQKHRLYLPNSVCRSLDNFEGNLRRSVLFVSSYWTDIEFPNDQTIRDQNEVMLAACNALETDLPTLRKVLEEECRKLLGANDVTHEKGAATNS